MKLFVSLLVCLFSWAAFADDFDQLIKKPETNPSATLKKEQQPQQAVTSVPPKATTPRVKTAPVVSRGTGVQLYAYGHFPPGPTYRIQDMKNLVGQRFNKPTYLVGKFIYSGSQDGKHIFTSYAILPSAYLKEISGNQMTSDDIALGSTVIEVKFHDNFPSILTPGRAIAPNTSEPLFLKSVNRGPDGNIKVQAECFSKP